jgi:guanosine-3',5'-bis(diphosphate) 3'-pyrophosphohydrolase
MNHRLKVAYEWMREAHEGQTRSNGEPYYIHPVRVMMQLQFQDAENDLLIAALMHDTVEDTPVTYKEIWDTFGDRVAHWVDAVTRRDGETYKTFILRVAEDKTAARLKIADIHDNLFDVDDYKPGLRKRYEAALEVLENAHRSTPI